MSVTNYTNTFKFESLSGKKKQKVHSLPMYTHYPYTQEYIFIYISIDNKLTKSYN